MANYCFYRLFLGGVHKINIIIIYCIIVFINDLILYIITLTQTCLIQHKPQLPGEHMLYDC
jgi:hypothetical protein